jgi:hypothetical protein
MFLHSIFYFYDSLFFANEFAMTGANEFANTGANEFANT